MKNLIKNWKYKRAISRIRKSFLFFGFDTSDFSDKEIEQGMNKMGAIILHSGFSVEKASRALKLILSLKS